MTEKAKRQDREETPEEKQPFSVEESSELAEELAPACDEQDSLNDDASTSEKKSTQEVPAPRARARRTRNTANIESAESDTAVTTEPAIVSAIPTDLDELEAQGFSADEAQRLIDISIRLESSAEARASQAELKRLRFAQWLVEHGILDEFKA